jgi:hypothetical protein
MGFDKYSKETSLEEMGEILEQQETTETTPVEENVPKVEPTVVPAEEPVVIETLEEGDTGTPETEVKEGE